VDIVEPPSGFGAPTTPPVATPGRRPAAPRPPVRRPRSDQSILGALRLGGLTRDEWIGVAAVLLSLLIAISAAAQDGSTRPVADPATEQPAPSVPAAPGPPAAAATSGTGCTITDPTGTGGCVTPTTAHALDQIAKAFGGYRKGPVIRSAGCWDKHAWNPSSDHPKGKGCDFFFGKAGVRAAGDELARGWQLAQWLRDNAGPLDVRYVIWQGRIWTDGHGDSGGWGKKYGGGRKKGGGSVYDPEDATGGHYDHVHVSFDR
jgi:hypothetical protein